MTRRVSTRWLAAAALAVALCPRPSPAAEAPAPGTIATVAGMGQQGYSGDGGPATAARFTALHGLAFDPAGRLYVLDAGHNGVRRIGADGVIVTVAGTGASGFSGDDGPATAATLNYPLDIAVDGAGNLFLIDGGIEAWERPGNERVLEVFGVAAPGLVAGRPFPALPQ